MKKSIVTCLLLFPMLTFAQEYQGVEDDAQKMFQKMDKMMACMASIDQEKMKLFEELTSQHETEIKSLCASGRRDKAQEKDMEFGIRIAKDPDLKEVIKCGDIMASEMKEVSFGGHGAHQHICDERGKNIEEHY